MINEIAVPVSFLVNEIKQGIEGAFGFVAVTGELTNLSKAYSGHIYFSLKDEHSQIRCALFKNQQKMNKTELRNDEEYIVYGRVSVYEPRTEITLIVNLITPIGEGFAALKLKMLREKLSKMGIFDEKHKKELPEYPEIIGVVTAQGGAAIHDIINVSRKRFPPAEIILSPSSVQGEKAEDELIKALERLSDTDVDVIIIGRGGGSKEDLEVFNSEKLAIAVANCPVPVVSAVGHETDSTILDLVASKSAPTPSAAAELIFPDGEMLLHRLLTDEISMKRNVTSKLNTLEMQLDNLMLSMKSPIQVIDHISYRTEQLLMSAKTKINDQIFNDLQQLQKMELALEKNNPLSPLERGFAMIEQNSSMIKRLNQFNNSQDFSITFKDGKVKIRGRE